MKTWSLWLVFGLVLLASVAGYRIGALSALPNTPSVASPASQQVPPLVLPDTAGQMQDLAQWSGKVLVINYWATWCPPCREEMPGFSRLQDKFGGKGVQFVGISIDQRDKVIAFQQETPVSYPLLIGAVDAMQSSVALGNSRQGLPFTAIFDQQGRLHSFRLGRLAEPDLERTLQRLLDR